MLAVVPACSQAVEELVAVVPACSQAVEELVVVVEEGGRSLQQRQQRWPYRASDRTLVAGQSAQFIHSVALCSHTSSLHHTRPM